MNRTTRSRRLLALVAGASLIAAACGDDDDAAEPEATGDAEPTETTGDVTATTGEPTGTTTPGTGTEPTGTGEGTEPTGTGTGTEPTGTGAAGEAAFRITYDIAEDANWSDGTPITWLDFECTYLANLNTPGSIDTLGYDTITSLAAGESDKQVVVEWSAPYAAYKTLFEGILKADEHEDCNDVSADFEGGITYSGREWMLDSWSPEQLVWVPNPEYTGPKTPPHERVVWVPAEDGTTLLKAGTVDYIQPQAYTGIETELEDPNVTFDVGLGSSYEAVYFMQEDEIGRPFSDDVFREAFYKSIDTQAWFDQIYAPFAAGTPLLDCGPIPPGDYCDPVFPGDNYDLEGAAALLEGDGWVKGADGLWAKDGNVPEIKWMVNTGNTRRESSQEFMIPKFREAGFNVVADNCEALPCVFETRLPGLDYDLTMYISTTSPDPSYISTWHCDQIPTEANNFQGQNQQGWCNEEASAFMDEADRAIDEAARADLVKQAIALMAEDEVMRPMLQFPNIGAYRTDRVENTAGTLNSYRGISDVHVWEDVDGDGTIVVGAEQFPLPECPNPITECQNSTWYAWAAMNPFLPGVWDPTNDQTYELTEMMAGEPVVEEL